MVAIGPIGWYTCSKTPWACRNLTTRYFGVYDFIWKNFCICSAISAGNKFEGLLRSQWRPRGRKGGIRHRLPNYEKVSPQPIRSVIPSTRHMKTEGNRGVSHENLISITEAVREANISCVVDIFERKVPVKFEHSLNVSDKIQIKPISKYAMEINCNFSLWNERSMTNKIPSVCDSILQNKTDVFILTESWITKRQW